MGCRYAEVVDCLDHSRCASCGWSPEVSRRQRAQLRDERDSRRKISRKLRDYQKQYRQRCFAPLSLQIGGRVDEALLRDISAGYLPWMPEADWERIELALERIMGGEE